ncbi:MAG: sensor histidine kinase, partial [Lachnospiraceae bacterium]|nr:sensor histidine kinase [Lachnospiraceae bacterium]
LSGLPSGFLPADRLFELTVMPLVYLVFFLTMGRYAAKHECYRNSDVRFHAVSAVTILICIGLTRLYGVFGEQRSITGSIYSIVCCLLALYIQFFLHRLKTAERETAAIEFVRREEKKQYALSKNAMDSINIKLHDLRHRLAGYEASVPREALESLSEDINIYESAIKTGNDALDVLLMEKSLSCRMKGITLTFSGNCASLSFMKTMDLYSLFGNAIDNAIEAAEGLEEEKRVIGVSVEERGDLIFATFTNYFDGTLRMADGLPETTKTDHPGYHGYGMKSMKLIAEKYAGGLSVTAKGDVFRLSVYLCRDRAA